MTYRLAVLGPNQARVLKQGKRGGWHPITQPTTFDKAKAILHSCRRQRQTTHRD